jgi:RNA polymerase sigma factor (sigma-70 family)
VESDRGSALIAAARRGDTTAFAELVEPHRRRLHAVAARVLGDREEAEDVVQEALLHAYVGLTQLRDPLRFGGWLRAIVVNVARMTVRRRSAYDRALTRAFTDPRRTAGEDDTTGLVHEKVESLPPAEREVVLLHYVDGLSCEEIGALVGRSAGAVRVRLHRARARLRHELAPFALFAPNGQREERPVVDVKIDDVLVRLNDDDQVVEDQRIVLLKEADGERVLPIWIGAAEGNALAFPIRGEASFRPMTSDLLAQVVELGGWRVERVAVTRLHENTFYASIALARDGRVEEIDARPSDALNLAARTSAPIAVAEDVLEEAAVTGDALDEKLAEQERKWRGDSVPEGRWSSLSAELLRVLHRPPR